MLMRDLNQFPKESSPTKQHLAGTCRNSIRLSLHYSCKAFEIRSSLSCNAFVQPGGYHLLGLQRTTWVCVTRRRGHKRERKEGRHEEPRDGSKEEPGLERKEEQDGDTGRYSDLCCCQRSSGSIQEICCPWSSIHLCPQWALRSWIAAPEEGKSRPSPEPLNLGKQLCFPWTNLAGADGLKTTEDSQGSDRLTAAFVSLHRKSPAALESRLLQKAAQHPWPTLAPQRARLGNGVCLCKGRECVVCKVSKMRSLITKKLAHSPAFMWREEEVILHSCTRLRYCERKLLRCPWESSVLVKIYKQAIKDGEACCVAFHVSKHALVQAVC